MICKKCNKNIDNDAKFCTYCGEKVHIKEDETIQIEQNIEKQEFFPSPKMFQGATKRIQGKHVEQDVHQIGKRRMHEHVGDKLPPHKLVAFWIIKGKKIIGYRHKIRADKKEDVNYQKLFYNRRDVHHRANFLSKSSTRIVMKVGL